MSIRHPSALIFTTLAMLGLAASAAEPVTLDQFAWQQGIELDAADQAVYRFELPANVYAHSRQSLGDLRIFNAAGEVVPHALLTYEAPAENDIAQLPLTFFPLRRDVGGKESLSVSVRRDKDGTLLATTVQTTPAPGTPDAPDAARAGYVVDAGLAKRSRRALLLDWQEQAAGTTLAVQIEGSNDLQAWHRIGAATQLVDLRSGSQRLLQNRIELGGDTHRYYRLHWPEGQNGITLTGVSLETSTVAAPPDRTQWTPVESLRAGTEPGEFLFDTQGLPLRLLRIGLPVANTVVPVSIQYRINDRAAWSIAATSIAYRMTRNGAEVVSPPIDVYGPTPRHWRLVFDQSGGGIGNGMPTIDLGWTPQQGLFVARGNGPFVLAYGSNAVHGTTLTAASLIPGYRPEQYPALASARFAEAPAQRSIEPTAPDSPRAPWRTYVLWSVLVAGVLLLGVMVWRLLGQLGEPQASPRPTTSPEEPSA